jgi:hypothetical protein
LTKQVEIDFFKTLSMLKSKDKAIYENNGQSFFKSADVETKTKNSTTAKTNNGFFLKDLEREMILSKMKASGDSLDTPFDQAEEESAPRPGQNGKQGYFEEQEKIKQSFKGANSDDEEDDDGLLKIKSKTKTDKVHNL